ncbi:MAG: M20/M25/M40 family metallo-hydrolase, partial [Nitrososphaeria archaeon]
MQKNIDRILDYVNEGKVIDYTRKLVNFDTQNPPGKEKELAEYLAEFLKTFGLKTTLIDFLPNRPNLFAEYKFSESGKTFLFDGHLDTVPVGNLSLWNFDPFSGIVKDGKLYGRGSADMKGSIAAFIHALG